MSGNTAVSTEWHVHVVRNAEPQQSLSGSFPGKCQLLVQCPNGRMHSSLFAIHLLPHWLRIGPGKGDQDAAQSTPVPLTGSKTAAMATDKLTDPNPTHHCVVGHTHTHTHTHTRARAHTHSHARWVRRCR